MEIKESRNEHGVCLTLGRSLDVVSCPALDTALEHLFAASRQAVYLDIGGITSVDSAGLALLLQWHRRALREERRFALVRANTYHRKVLEITQLDRTLVLYDEPGGERIAQRPLYGIPWRRIRRPESERPTLELLDSGDLEEILDEENAGLE